MSAKSLPDEGLLSAETGFSNDREGNNCTRKGL